MSDFVDFEVGLQPLAPCEHTFFPALSSRQAFPKSATLKPAFVMGQEFSHVVGRKDQRPFASDLLQAPQGKLTKPMSLFHLLKDGFHDDFPFCIAGMPPFRQQGPPHPVGFGQALRVPFPGSGRLMAMYDRALTQAEIRQNFDAGATGQ